MQSKVCIVPSIRAATMHCIDVSLMAVIIFGSWLDLLKSFLEDTVGDSAGDDLTGFSFADTVEELANDLINAIVVDFNARSEWLLSE